MKKILTLVAAGALAGQAMALDLGNLQKQADNAMKDPTVKAVADKAGSVANDKAAEELTKKLKSVQNEKGPIVFKSGTAALDASKCENTLKAIDGIIKQFPGFKVTIEGHTDNKGKAAANQKLSQMRAEAVVKWLKEHLQTPAEQMTAKGFGSSKPIADNKTEAGRAKNRRVDFSVTKL